LKPKIFFKKKKQKKEEEINFGLKKKQKKTCKKKNKSKKKKPAKKKKKQTCYSEYPTRFRVLYNLFFCLIPFLPLNLKKIYIISLFVIDDLFFILLKPKKIQYHYLLSIINFYYIGITCLSWFFLLLK
jgi:hypothetical protein